MRYKHEGCTVKTVKANQQGVVSIMIALVFMLVTLLIVTGFAQVARRNSRVALDTQLSSQAAYAAESGVNDAVKGIQARIAAGQAVTSQTTCLPSGTGTYVVNSGVISDGVSYTCQLVNAAPSELSYDSVSDSSIVIPVEATTGSLGTLAVSWQKAAGLSGTSSCTFVPSLTAGNWPATWPVGCHYGVMRIDILPATVAAMANADTAAAATATAFVYPRSGATTTFAYTGAGNRSGASAAQGQVLAAGCDASVCRLNVSGLNFPKAYFRVSFLYRPTQNLQIAGTTGSSITFQNAQVIVDVTGRAQDVLRRVQVRVPVGGNRTTPANGFSEYAMQSNTDICKRYYAVPAPTVIAQPTDGC